jgi:hypothetical protein
VARQVAAERNIVSRIVPQRCESRKRGDPAAKRYALRPSLRRGGNCQIEYKPLLGAARSPMLCEESSDRNQPDKLPGLSQCEYPAIQTPVTAGLSFWLCGDATVALRSLRFAVLCAPNAVSHVLVRALRNLRQPGIATHLRRARSRHDGISRPYPGAPRTALPTLPPQVFFGAPAAPRRAKRRPRAHQVDGTIRGCREEAVETKPDFLLIALDEPLRRPPLCDLPLREFPALRIIAVARNTNVGIYYWA